MADHTWAVIDASPVGVAAGLATPCREVIQIRAQSPGSGRYVVPVLGDLVTGIDTGGRAYTITCGGFVWRGSVYDGPPIPLSTGLAVRVDVDDPADDPLLVEFFFATDEWRNCIHSGGGVLLMSRQGRAYTYCRGISPVRRQDLDEDPDDA